MKISFKEFGDVLRKFHEDAHISKQLRFGQFFCNRYNITDPNLFYATDYEVAIGLVMDNYLDLEIDYSTSPVGDYEGEQDISSQ